jgi:peroxiredoxin Q/BCP
VSLGASTEDGAESSSTEPAELVKKTPVAVGDKMIDIKLPNQDGQLLSLSGLRSEEGPFGKNQLFGKVGKSVVLFFFAGSASPSCTKEAQAFTARYNAFQAKGCEVFGISSDSVEFQKEWKAKEGIPFDLLSDEGGKLRESLDIPKDVFGFLEGRQTYIIDDDGVVKKIYNDQFGPEKHVEESLDALSQGSGRSAEEEARLAQAMAGNLL